MKNPNVAAPTRKVRREKITAPFQLPASIETPRIEQNEWGCRLPERPYFPMLLGNGVDAMLINLLGSGEMHWERNMRSANPLPRLMNTEWYKADRRDHSHSESVYGQLMPFLDFSSGPMLRNDFVVPRDVKQFFDPRTATITTFISQLDNRTGEPLELRSQTFLTHDGMLVQAVHCIKAPAVGAQYLFTVGEPGPEYLYVRVPLVKPADARFEQDEKNANFLRYSSHWEQGRAVGFSLVGGADVKEVLETRRQRPSVLQMDQRTATFHEGSTVWRVLTLQDTREGQDPDAVCDELLERISREGIDGLHQAHCAIWEEYFSTSSVTLPDPAAQFLYDVSRYVIKANLHPCGYLPMGSLPYLWQGAMFWDASFAQQALLGCGNLREAASIPRHFLSLEKAGRELAQQMGSQGIRIEWTANLFDYSTYDHPVLQVHNNAVWAYAFLLEASYTNQPVEDRVLDFVRELLAFLVDRLVQRGNDGKEAPIIGIDESYSDPKPNDTWSLAICLKALEEFAGVCEERGIDHEIPDLSAARTRLESLLHANTDAAGILQSFTGGAIPHWGSLVFDLFPDAPEALPTLAKMSQNYHAETDLFNFHGITRYAERAFPWANNWAARCLARMRRPEALHFWLNNTRSTNGFGGVPERIYYHGELYINWCMTGHAAQVWAMNAMLADFRNGMLTLLGGIDIAVWTNLSFEGIRTPGGFSISLRIESGKITYLAIESACPESRSMTLCIPPIGVQKEILIQPGHSTINTASLST